MRYDFLLDQEDLAPLCKDRSLQTSEIHITNDFYGQASVIKDYIGVSNSYSLKAVLEHGIMLDDLIWDVDREARLPIFLSSSLHRASLHRHTNKLAIPVGFGFLYAIENFNNLYQAFFKTSSRRGTIVFPSHSTHHIKASFDFQDYANRLESLPDKFKPIVVCMYWKDFLNGHHLAYARKGFNIVTAGHIYDPLFLLRLYDLCRQFKYSTSNDIGTHLFASIQSGCSFFYTGIDDIIYENPNQFSLDFTHEFSNTKYRSIELFNQPLEKMNTSQKSFVDEYLGTEHFKSPSDLRCLFLYAEVLDKFFLRFPQGDRVLDRLPTYFQRNGERLKAKIFRLTQRLIGA